MLCHVHKLWAIWYLTVYFGKLEMCSWWSMIYKSSRDLLESHMTSFVCCISVPFHPHIRCFNNFNFDSNSCFKSQMFLLCTCWDLSPFVSIPARQSQISTLLKSCSCENNLLNFIRFLLIYQGYSTGTDTLLLQCQPTQKSKGKRVYEFARKYDINMISMA